MNNNVYNSGAFTPTNPNTPGSPLYYGNIQTPNQQTAPNGNAGQMDIGIGQMNEEDYIEDVLKKVEPIKATFYMTFSGSNEWRDKVFHGILEATGKDHVILSNPETGKWTLLPNIYIDYIEFDEDIKNYIRNHQI